MSLERVAAGRALWPAIAAAALLFCALPAQAVKLFVIEYQGRRALAVEDEAPSKEFPRGGSIRSGDAKRFEQALREAMPVSEVLFNSGGGSEPDGLAIGRAIRRAGLSTRVPKGARCASACADAFMGGVARRVDEGGRYGIHMGTVANDPETVDKIYRVIVDAYDKQKGQLDHSKVRQVIQLFEQLSAQSAARWGAFVLEMGGSPRIVDVGAQSAASQMNWLTRQQLLDLNVVNVDN